MQIIADNIVFITSTRVSVLCGLFVTVFGTSGEKTATSNIIVTL